MGLSGEQMTLRLYLVPITHIDLGNGTEFAAPKYFWGRLTEGSLELQGATWAWERYVWENHGLVAADTSASQDTYLRGLVDVISVPALDNTIANTATRNKIRNILEAGNIPGTWVNTGMTYRSVVRIVLGIFKFHGRAVSLLGKMFDGTISLDMTISQIPADKLDKMQQAADAFGLDTSWMVGTTTIRALLKSIGDQFSNTQFEIGGFLI